jgi:hypothetical protein
MSFANNLKFVTVAAAFAVSGAAFAGADDAKTTASLSPATQLDWDSAHRDANAYAAANTARTDERLLVKSDRANDSNYDAKNADVKHVAQSKAAAPQSTK